MCGKAPGALLDSSTALDRFQSASRGGGNRSLKRALTQHTRMWQLGVSTRQACTFFVRRGSLFGQPASVTWCEKRPSATSSWQMWLEMITSRDAKSACFKGSRRHVMFWERQKYRTKGCSRYWRPKFAARKWRICCKNQCSHSGAVDGWAWAPFCVILWGWLKCGHFLALFWAFLPQKTIASRGWVLLSDCRHSPAL